MVTKGHMEEKQGRKMLYNLDLVSLRRENGLLCYQVLLVHRDGRTEMEKLEVRGRSWLRENHN